jgi:hypothetical protein
LRHLPNLPNSFLAAPESMRSSLSIASGFGKRMPILNAMPELPPFAAESSDASWSQLEALVERLHAAARSELTPREFYGRLLAEACRVTGAVRRLNRR